MRKAVSMMQTLLLAVTGFIAGRTVFCEKRDETTNKVDKERVDLSITKIKEIYMEILLLSI